LNLIEAIRSGRGFKRRGWDTDRWLKKAEGGDYCFYCALSVSDQRRFSPDEVVAEDWETEEPTVTVTRTQFWEAASSAFNFTFQKYSPFGIVEYRGPAAPPVGQVQRLAIALGLGES